MSVIFEKTETNETQCSTMHCRNRAKVKIIAWRGKWWMPILNPAPFCDDCEKGNFTDKPKNIK